ncbi:hypothetical protein, partial [Paludibacterium purpuratum]
MADVLNTATRRVKLQFDKQGNPYFESVKSPDSFKQRALCVNPPHNVIPVIFVPGIMGTNLKLADNKGAAWAPPNGTLEGIGAATKGTFQDPAERQVLFDPNNTEVNPDGPCQVPDSLFWLTTAEAKRRGWGALHQDSYHPILQQLEISLNDQYSLPGRPQAHGNHPLPEIGMLSHLAGSSTPPPQAPGYNRPPDYASIAAEAVKAWNTQPRAL